MFTHEGYAGHEKVFMFQDLGGRLKGMIAIHNSMRGPALGGCRFMEYGHPSDALNDVLKLSEGMTYKSTWANLPLGGGKSVLFANGFDGRDRKEIFECFGKHINELAGQYYTGIDVGTTLEDMHSIRKTSPYVCGVKKPLDGSTAQGAFNAILGVCEHQDWDISKITVAIQGVGKTGYGLAKLLHDAGAQLIVADINAQARGTAAANFNAMEASPSDIITAQCDILAPCALGGVIDVATVPLLNCKAVCGIANNQLVNIATAQALWDAGIVYVPDFIVNAGGVIAACEDVTGEDHTVEIDNIKDRVLQVLSGTEANWKAQAPAKTNVLRTAYNYVENELGIHI